MAVESKQIKSPLPLTYYKGNIVILLNYNHRTLRYNLFKVDKNNFLPKTRALKASPNYDLHFVVSEIEKKAEEVNLAIIELQKRKTKDESITKAEIDEEIRKMSAPVIAVKQQRAKSFVEEYESWIDDFREKKRQSEITKGLKPRKNHPTVKDYVSALNLLKDFQHDKLDDKPFVFNDITQQFIGELILYAYDLRGDDEEEGDEDDGYKHLTKGGLSNKTLNKRFDCIFSFIMNVYKKMPDGVEKKPRLETIQKTIIRLDRDEIRQLEELKIKEEDKAKHYEFYRDCIVFLCYTGLRFGDFKKLDRSYYHSNKNLIVLQTEKTRKRCEIFLFDKALEIAQKYNFDFKPVENQTLNRGMKEFFEAYDLFPDEITIDYMAQGRKTITKKKRDFISCHTGRRSYISMMLENGMDVYELISTTGHTKIDTLKHYVDLFGKKRMETFKNINEAIR